MNSLLHRLLRGAICAAVLTALPSALADTYVVRDSPTGIFSSTHAFVSTRYMRHIWLAPDQRSLCLVVQKGGHDGHGLVLYASGPDLVWHAGDELLPDEPADEADLRLISDGVMTEDGTLFVVTSALLDRDVRGVTCFRFDYDADAHTWALAGQAPVVQSTAALQAGRATVAVDSTGRLWCAWREGDFSTADDGVWSIRLRYSENGGVTWQDSGQSFVDAGTYPDRNPRVLAAPSASEPGVALVYHDGAAAADAETEWLAWGWRPDSAAATASWAFTSRRVADTRDTVEDVYGTHWSVTTDGRGSLVVTYQDRGIHTAIYSPGPATWEISDEVLLGTYSVTAYSPRGLYQFQDYRTPEGALVVGRQHRRWWQESSAAVYQGKLRMCVPAQFDRYLPLAYQVDRGDGGGAPYELLFSLLRVD
jgi:hypothetical protein